MQIQRLLIGSALVSVILTGCQHSLGNMPTVTRTGELKDIVILDTVSPATVTVNPGDEIRWINKRQGDVRVIFLTPVMESLSCQRNFGGSVANDQSEYTAALSTNDTASVCFRGPAELKYVVRAKSTEHPSGEQNIPGSITVASEAVARPSIDTNATHTAQSKEEEAAPSQSQER
jgi:plastocyanin